MFNTLNLQHTRMKEIVGRVGTKLGLRCRMEKNRHAARRRGHLTPSLSLGARRKSGFRHYFPFHSCLPITKHSQQSIMSRHPTTISRTIASLSSAASRSRPVRTLPPPAPTSSFSPRQIGDIWAPLFPPRPPRPSHMIAGQMTRTFHTSNSQSTSHLPSFKRSNLPS